MTFVLRPFRAETWRELAKKFGDIKFCQMQANLCIEGYPDRNTPTVLIYKDGEIKRQLVTLKELNGVKTNMAGELISHFRTFLFRPKHLLTRAITRPREGAAGSWRAQAQRLEA